MFTTLTPTKGQLSSLLCVFGVWLLSTQAACAAEPELQRTLSVSGTGVAAVAPDVAVVRLGVNSRAANASAAMSANSARVEAVMQALRDGGVRDLDIQTQNLQLQPRYDRSRRPDDNEPRLIGYEAINIVQARIRDVNAVGGLLDAAIKGGANRVDSIRFEVSDPTAVLKVARAAAWQDALDKATQLADLAGATLGPVRSIESRQRTPGPVQEMSVFRMSGDAVPVAPGMAQSNVTIEVTWSLR